MIASRPYLLLYTCIAKHSTDSIAIPVAMNVAVCGAD
jgi:hypothetical protein